jgi:hypothetical protein
MKIIEQFIEEQTVTRMFHHVYRFKNGYGASVSMNWNKRTRYGTNGADDHLWELAVIHFKSNGDFVIDYNTPVTEDVRGWINENVVEQLLYTIAKYPKYVEQLQPTTNCGGRYPFRCEYCPYSHDCTVKDVPPPQSVVDYHNALFGEEKP